jgi:uncharacterized LabA/DUF88 family protein
MTKPGPKKPKRRSHGKDKRNEITYAFIDSQNLNLGTSKDIFRKGKLLYEGWKIDMNYFRKYLTNKFRVKKAFLFIGYIHSNQSMYQAFRRFGYDIIFKPTVKDRYGKVKGNVDAEIVLNAARLKYDEYDKSVFVSGDGDFYCLYDFLEKEDKLKNILIPNKYSESSLLKRFHKYKVFLYREKKKLERK